MSDFFMDVFFNGGLTESLILMTQLACTYIFCYDSLVF